MAVSASIAIVYCESNAVSKRRALALWDELSARGFTVKIDQAELDLSRWSDWVEIVLESDKVIIVVDEAYVAECTGSVLYSRIQTELYLQGRYNRKFVPIVFQDFGIEAMPPSLADLGWTRLDGRDWGNIDELHARLMDVQLWEPPPQPAKIALPRPPRNAVGLPPDVYSSRASVTASQASVTASQA